MTLHKFQKPSVPDKTTIMDTFQTALKFSATVLAIAAILTACGDDKASTTTDAAGTDTGTVDAKTDNKIPELKPVDVYLNFEKQGFTTTKNLSSEYGNSWDCKSSSSGIDYHVNVFSDDINSVERVRATAMLNGSENKQIVATKPFLKYVASVPFEGNDPAKFSEWFEKNFNNDKQSLTISGVKFTIYAPTNLLRMLDIEKAN